MVLIRGHGLAHYRFNEAGLMSVLEGDDGDGGQGWCGCHGVINEGGDGDARC
jgi:hypothetical protein